MFPGETLLSSAVGAGLNYYGSKRANEANKKIAREQMAFQQASNREHMGFTHGEAQEQMAFQERMSNTAYQRSMEDMKKAGLNPILAFNQGGASTPSGASGSGASSAGASARMENEFSNAVSSALDAKRLRHQIENIDAQTEQVRALTRLALLDVPGRETDAQIDGSKAGMFLKIWQRLMPGLNSFGGLIR